MRKFRNILTIALTALLLMASQCNALNRAVAALDSAPALIDSFVNSGDSERAQLKQYFSDAASALRAYQAERTDGNWSKFISALQNVANAHVSDARGAQRIAAIVGLVRVIFGINDSGPTPTATRSAAARHSIRQPPETVKVKDSDVKRLEELMKPIQ